LATTAPRKAFGSFSSKITRKKRGWNHVEHSDLFYEKFTNLLILAEELKILVLNGDVRTKFSLKNIKKFDLIDSFLDDDTNGKVKLPAATGILQLQVIVRFST
jgi:hypothetical protein